MLLLRRVEADRTPHTAQSKLGNVLFSTHCATLYAPHGISSFYLNPGNIRTPLLKHATRFETLALYPVQHGVERRALTQLYAGTTPDALKYNGEVR